MTSGATAVPSPLNYGHWLAVGLHRLPEALAAPASLGVVSDMARLMPLDCLGGLEIRLGPGHRDEPVDLSVELSSAEQAQQVLHLIQSPGLRAVLRTWALGKISRRALPAFWLEFDAQQAPASGLPEPLMLVRFGPKVPPHWLLDSFIPSFHGEPLTERQATLLAEAVRQLPQGFRPVYLFSLRSRGSPAIRLDSVGMDLSLVPPYLRAVVSPEAAERVAELLPLVGDADSPHFSFDIGPEGYGTRLGVECSYLRQAPREERWQKMLQRLVDKGLCLPEQREALLAWPGSDTPRSASQVWPLDEQGEPVKGVCARAISHVKLSFSPGKPVQAKAYLIVKYVQRSKG